MKIIGGVIALAYHRRRVCVAVGPDTVTEPGVMMGYATPTCTCVSVSCASVKVRLVLPGPLACRVSWATTPVPFGPAATP